MSNSLFKTAIASASTLLISSFFLLANPVKANLFVSPLYLKAESEQGQSKGILQIGNTSNKPIRVRLSATAFNYDLNGDFKRLDSDGKLKKDLTPYLRYSPREMMIPANSSRRVRLISLLPPSLPDGEYRTAIFAETLQERTNSQGYKVGFNISVGSALYVTKGEAKSDIEIEKPIYDPVKKKIKVLVANDGSATAKGTINWTLKQEDKVIASGQSGGSFLPSSKTNTTLNRVADKQIDLTSGQYQLTGEIVWNRLDQQQKSNFDFELEI